MLVNGTYLVESVGIVRQMSPETDLLKIKFNYQEEPVYMFGSYSETVEFIGQKAIAEFREEFIEGTVSTVINNLAVVHQVTTLDREEGLRLYTDFDFTIGSNLIFKNIKENDYVEKAIVYCKTVEAETSDRATWVKLTVLDKERNVGYIRVFDADNSSKEFEGKYIKCGVRKTKYGFVAQDVYVRDDITVSTNPKITIARKYVESVVKSDSVLVEYINKYSLIDKIQDYKYEAGEEQGMLLVRLAMELSLIKETINLSNEIDIELLIRLAVASKSYVVSTPDTTTYSRKMQNLIVVTTHSALARDRKIICCMDSEDDSPVKLIERKYYKHIEALAKTLIEISGPDEFISTLEGIKR